MAASKVAHWRKLSVTPAELSLDTTLRCGQSFRWRKTNDEWTCALRGRIFSLTQDTCHVHFKVTGRQAAPSLSTPPASEKGSSPDAEDDSEEILRNYLTLNLDLGSLYKKWADADPNFRRKAPHFTGVRILSQDPWETLVAFICSSNNNISRISQMVHKICRHYGPVVGHVDGEAIHDFPTPTALTGANVESHLRELGFGYRAKYVTETARIIAREKPAAWLESLQSPKRGGISLSTAPERACTYKEAHEQLLSLAGVGPKVADCVCLMGLGWGESVPVDTHVWQIAQRDYKVGKSNMKTLNKAMYEAVGDHFRNLWGEYAGWAHSVLFTADLREFANQAARAGPTAKGVEVKGESVERLQLTRDRKRKEAARAVVTSEAKHEDLDGGCVVDTRRTARRRRVRKRL